MATIWWCVAAASLVVLVMLMQRLGRHYASDEHERTRPRSLWQLLKAMHGSDSAIASMEFLMVFFPFLIIVMTVWQFAFMFNAQLQVGYSAYAAARSAAVTIPAEMPDEPEGILKGQGEKQDGKWRSIRRAAIPGVIAISPGDPVTALAVGGQGVAFNDVKLPSNANLSDFVAQHLLGLAHYGTAAFSGSRERRFVTKAVYAAKVTEVLINGQDHEQNLTLTAADTVTVTVNYVFWLQVPFVGRMLEALFQGRVDPTTGQPIDLPLPVFYPNMILTETISMKSWLRKRATDPCP